MLREAWRRLRGLPAPPFREDLFWQALAAAPDFSPVFFLSTGRAGTLFFTELLQETPALLVGHEPQPALVAQSRLMYETLPATGADAALLRLAGQVFVVARQQVLAECLAAQRGYVETNNRITFFAPALLQLFPRVRFVHLYRHPVSFIRSGLARQWYTGRHPHDVGRILPRPGTPQAEGWAQWSDIERIAWLWAETGDWITRFLAQVPAAQQVSMYFEQPDAAAVARVLRFCGAALPRDLDARVGRPRNAQATDQVPRREAWSAGDEAALQRHAGPLAARLGIPL